MSIPGSAHRGEQTSSGGVGGGAGAGDGTSEILRVISRSPTAIQPVMDAMTESAGRLCGAYDAAIFRHEEDSLELVAHHGPLAGPIGLMVPLVRGTVAGRSVLERRTIQVSGLQAEVEEFPEGSVFAKELGHRTVLSVPPLRERVAIGSATPNRQDSSRALVIRSWEEARFVHCRSSRMSLAARHRRSFPSNRAS